ncbi:MAG TPA: type I polyketide synthase, partial [Polyangiaceae bacterium]|nr:type I polyketide synthase [Polyangiaceae bacterium]
MTADQAIEQIAIVGMAGRFPKARSTDEYWANLRDGVDCISRLAVPELLADGVDPALLKRAEYVAAKGVLDEPGGFDAGFFGYSPREAELLDPQHRVFLECCWEALENSGRVPNRCPELVGLYAGSGLNSYFVNNVVPRDGFELGGAAGYQAYVASDKDFLATRVAYKLDFRGPSLTVQTACSTSLVAVTLACQALLSYQCDLALAGGVAISSPQRAGYLYQEGMILSPDGRCRPFDRNAGGTVLGNGAGVVVLKRLSEAIADGDDIRAVILGAAVNNDGAAKAGYTTPSIEGQRDVVRQAQALAGVEPASISYIEAHGTGTPVGDPIELAALREVFASVRGAKRCGIGSVKSNIGHLDAAAGVASLLKVVLALQNEQLPRTLHFEAANPELGLDDSCFFVVRETTEWKRGALPRRAGVSSFGIGGSNAHVILQEAPRRARSAESARAYHVLNLSARSASALQQLARAYVATLGRPDCPALADVCHTAATGRARFSQRLSVVASSLDDAKSKLQHHLAGESPEPGVVTAVAQTNPRIAFLFTGQGSQYAKMGLELYEGEEVYREAVERCLSALGGRGEQLRR